MSTLKCVWGFSGVVSPHAEKFPRETVVRDAALPLALGTPGTIVLSLANSKLCQEQKFLADTVLFMLDLGDGCHRPYTFSAFRLKS